MTDRLPAPEERHALAGRKPQPSWREALAETAERNWLTLRQHGDQIRFHLSDRATYVHDEAIHWMAELPPCSLHAIVTDPPYGLVEYEDEQLAKRRAGRGGVWRIPPSFDGARRAALPRFTVVVAGEIAEVQGFLGAVPCGG